MNLDAPPSPNGLEQSHFFLPVTTTTLTGKYSSILLEVSVYI